MNVVSFLNQPFNAEIPLLDVGGLSLEGIKATLASPEEFERAGVTFNDILSFLTFEVKKDPRGQPVINIKSTERMPDPILQIVVDLAWINGQLYRAYTVLLDPPGYKLDKNEHTTLSAPPVLRKAHKSIAQGVIDKPGFTDTVNQAGTTPTQRKETTYGPILPTDSIWQIAQRYSTADASLQQIILAIVGTNSQAFTQGNLNALKTGEQLRIPSNEEVLKVPAELAKGEVDAHDKAWKEHQEIQHVLLPPYIDGVKGASQFVSPVTDQSVTPSAKIEPIPLSDNAGIPKQQEVVNKAELDVFRAENRMFNEQLTRLQKENKQLQKTMLDQKEDIAQIRKQIQLLIKQQKTPLVNTSIPISKKTAAISFYLLGIVGALGGAGLLYWLSRRNEENDTNEPVTEPKTIETPNIEPKSAVLSSLDPVDKIEKVSIDVEEEQAPTESFVDLSNEFASIGHLTSEPLIPDETVIVNPQKPLPEVAAVDYLLDFEPGLDKLIAPPLPDEHNQPSEDETTIDYPVDEPSISRTLIKSKSALNTLLALAKTYIGMGDIDAANQSLQEVLTYGDEDQKNQAKKLLDELKKN